MTKNLKHYQKNRVEKLDAFGTGVTIERRHKVFLESNNLNLSAIVRDAIDSLMAPTETEIEVQARKIASVYAKAGNFEDEIETLIKILEAES
jgi:hypothetical protein